MKVCFAVEQDRGYESTVYGHFGSAPAFLLIDTDGGDGTRTIGNRDQHHVHGACNPIMAIGGEDVDAVVVGGIGAGALMRLNSAGITVFRAGAPTVKENMELLKDGRLPRLSVRDTCAGHGGGCAHKS